MKYQDLRKYFDMLDKDRKGYADAVDVQRELPAFLNADTDIETVCIYVCMKYMYI